MIAFPCKKYLKVIKRDQDMGYGLKAPKAATKMNEAKQIWVELDR